MSIIKSVVKGVTEGFMEGVMEGGDRFRNTSALRDLQGR